MKPMLLLTVPAALVAAGVSLQTRYEAERVLRVEIETTLEMDTETRMERDGQPVEGRGGGGSSSSDTEFKEVHVDKLVEVEKGKPAKVERHFEELGGSRSFSFGEREGESEVETPIEGLTVRLTGEDGDVTAEVVDGTKPEDEKAFAFERLTLFVDGVLPGKDVEEGASWELSKEQVLSILRLDAHRGLFPPPPRDGGENGGGGRRGGSFGGGELRLLIEADWKGKATLADASAEVDGVQCAVIELELTASGELAMPERGPGGGGRRGGMPEAEPTTPALGNSYEIDLEGKLAFDLAAKRPVSLDVEGKVSNVTDMEREGREGGTIKMHSERKGKFKLAVKVSEQKAEK
jgi:hypothetical protein